MIDQDELPNNIAMTKRLIHQKRGKGD